MPANKKSKHFVYQKYEVATRRDLAGHGRALVKPLSPLAELNRAFPRQFGQLKNILRNADLSHRPSPPRPADIVKLLQVLGRAGLHAILGGTAGEPFGGIQGLLRTVTSAAGPDLRGAMAIEGSLSGTASALNLQIQTARQLQEAASQLGRAALAQLDAAGQLKEAASAFDQAYGTMTAGDTANAGGSLIMRAFGGRELSALAPALKAILGRTLGGPAGTILSAAASGAIAGARIGAASGRLLLGGLAGGGLAAAGVLAGIGISKLIGALFHHGPNPAQRAAEIERILQANRYVEPAAITRDLAFGGGESDSGFNNVPRVVVNVSAMDARSFQERSADIAKAVRRELIEGMHPINMALREAF